MKLIAIAVAAAALAASPAALAKPGDQGKGGEGKAHASGKAQGPSGGKAQASVKTQGQGGGKAQGSAKVRADVRGKSDAAVKVRADAKSSVRSSADSGGQWMYRGRQYEQFDLPAYRLPPGQAKKVFNQGERLPAAYYAQNPSYMLSNPAQYQLQPPPAGYRWVRVDNDVYLVRTDTGVITDIVRRIFR
jgi:Ni/Co efflux regulator RcnB